MSIVTECCVVLRPEGKTQNLISRKKKPRLSLFLSHPLLSISLPHLSPTQLAFGFVLLLSLPPFPLTGNEIHFKIIWKTTGASDQEIISVGEREREIEHRGWIQDRDAPWFQIRLLSPSHSWVLLSLLCLLYSHPSTETGYCTVGGQSWTWISLCLATLTPFWPSVKSAT